MPEFIVQGGVKIYRPGAYATVDASALSGTGAGQNAVAYLGDFPDFEPAQPVRFLNQEDLVAYDPTSSMFALWAKLAFAPSKDNRVAGGAGSLTIVNAGTSTQAQVTLQDGTPANAAVLKSKLWGAKGNRVSYSLSNDVADGRDMTMVFNSNGVTETLKTKAVDVATLGYVSPSASFYGNSNDTVTLDWTPVRANITWQKGIADVTIAPDVITAPAAWEAPIAGKLTVGSAMARAGEVVVEVFGFDIAGAPDSETVTLLAGTSASVDTAKDYYSYITGITITSDTNQAGLDIEIAPKDLGLELKASDYNSLQEMVKAIDTQPWFSGTVIEPRAIPADEPDSLLSASLSNGGNPASKNLLADLWGFLNDISGSDIVESSRATGAVAPPNPSEETLLETVAGFLLGGGATAANATTWQAALDSLRNVDINFLALETADISILSKLAAHFDAAALNGYPRQAWVGPTAGLNLNDLKAQWSGVLNSAYVAMVPQTADTPAPSGTGTVPLTTAQYALMHAGMQAGMALGTPLTTKRPDVTAVYEASSWSHENPDDLKTAIKAGLCVTSLGGKGLKVERSVTTYLTDNNPIWSEASTVNSVNGCVRKLLLAVDHFIGGRAISGTASSIKAAVAASLNDQVSDGTIKGFRNVRVVDNGTSFAPFADVAFVEPINFIPITLNAIRIPQNA